MKRYLALMILAGVLVLIVLNLPGEGQKPGGEGPEAKGKAAGFSLPRRQTTLTFVERKGKTLYDFYCVLCHGATGNGDGFNSFNLTQQPAKLADPHLLAKLSDAQIMAVVKKGGAALGLSSQMPSWGSLFKDQDITSLIAYVRTLSKPGGE